MGLGVETFNTTITTDTHNVELVMTLCTISPESIDTDGCSVQTIYKNPAGRDVDEAEQAQHE